MATIRERQPGVWEVRVFTGRTEAGQPTQISRTVRGGKRDAQRVAATLESRPPSSAAGRTVADVVEAWREVNRDLWSEASRRDYASRASFIAKDPIAKLPIARLGVGDVERWHARMRRAGVGAAAIRSRHSVLRAALSQAVRWEWIGANVATRARLRQPRQTARDSMSSEDVCKVIEAAQKLDRAAGLALRLAAVGGLRRSELAALQWTDFDLESRHLTVDSGITVVRGGDDGTVLIDSVTKTADRRVLRLDTETIVQVAALRDERECVGPYVFSVTVGPPNPDRIGWWWRRAREESGIDSKWRLHDLRHWTATAAITSGHDVRTVAGRLGHANPAMTLRVYAHAIESADVQLAESLGTLLDEPVTSRSSSST